VTKGKNRRDRLSRRAQGTPTSYYFLPFFGAFFAPLAFLADFAFFLGIHAPLENVHRALKRAVKTYARKSAGAIEEFRK
jgi:hypothetical protein